MRLLHMANWAAVCFVAVVGARAGEAVTLPRG